MIDIWRNYIELSQHNLGKASEITYGTLFLKDDRELAKQNIRKMIEIHLVPHLANKITQIELSVKKTRAGVMKKLSRFFSKSTQDRNADDGLKENFRMNKSELELRCLIDLSLTVQDYETVVNNAGYPIDDFKAI
jgi:hypothetical protein